MPPVFTCFNHGTAFHRDKEGEIVAEFGRLASGREYEDFISWGRKTRDFLAKHQREYVKHSSFFINEHHRRTFKRAYPAIYDWVFEDWGTNGTAVLQEYRAAKNLTALNQTLEVLGFQSKPGTQALVPIRGKGKQQVEIQDGQHTASLSRMGLY